MLPPTALSEITEDLPLHTTLTLSQLVLPLMHLPSKLASAHDQYMSAGVRYPDVQPRHHGKTTAPASVSKRCLYASAQRIEGSLPVWY